MARPLVTGTEEMTAAAACDLMAGTGVGSVVIVDSAGSAVGIVTERDILRALSRVRAGVLDIPLSELMSGPVECVPATGYLSLAIARMTRSGKRHLVVVDEDGRPAGIVSARSLLKLRSGEALMIGDDVSHAQSAGDLARSRAALPALAGALLADGVAGRDVASVISSVLRDMTARAAEIAQQTMAADGWGTAPARFALLVLGSGGRGESLLAFDQDNALVHEGTATDDVWFAEFGRRLNMTLAEAGIPLCEGDVMVRNPFWRRTMGGWEEEIRHWVFEPRMQTVMNVDIFFDFVPVLGDTAMAGRLKDYAIGTASTSAFFVQFLALNVAQMEIPLGIFGEFITTHGRLNAKKYGLLPLVSAARARAVKAGIRTPSTAGRYSALQEAGLLHRDDLASLLDCHETLLRAMLEQQLADLAAGLPPSARIEPRALPRAGQRRLKAAFKRIRALKAVIGA